jgi:O-antigen/teichoic acid export membrane protein
MLGLLGVAEPLVPILLGAQWVSSVPFFQVLCVVGMLWPLHVTNLNALMAQGHSRLFFRLDVIKKVIYLSMLIIASQLSVLAIAWGSVVTSIIAAFINSHYTRKFLNYSVADQGLDIAPYTGIALIMLIVVSAIGRLFIDQAPLVRLLLMIFSGAIFYALAICVLRLEAYRIIRRYIFQC